MKPVIAAATSANAFEMPSASHRKPAHGFSASSVHARPDDMRMVDIRWDKRTLVMFAVDILERGEEIAGKSAKA
jgi:hypothetical protein